MYIHKLIKIYDFIESYDSVEICELIKIYNFTKTYDFIKILQVED
ncbi:hypothetical protein QP531_05525 [Peptoniphilus harei]|nr:hypothetical protein [Peptoniphilus harei]